MHLILSLFLVTVFSTTLIHSKFSPPTSTKQFSQTLQRFAVFNNSETYISLFSRPVINFLLIKKIDSTPSIRIESFDKNDEICADLIRFGTKLKVVFEARFSSGSKILIKNSNNFDSFLVESNCGEFGPMDFYQKLGEMDISRNLLANDPCLKQYKKIDESFDAVEVRIESSVPTMTCGFFLVLGKDTYISDSPNPNDYKQSIPFNKTAIKSNSNVPESLKNYFKFNENSNEIEMDLKQISPERIEFFGEKFFSLPSFRFDFGKDCSNHLAYLQFFDNPKCMATVSLSSSNDLIIETAYGSLKIPGTAISKTKFFADLTFIYSITEPSKSANSESSPKFQSLLLCEIMPDESLPYFKITKIKPNLKCSKSTIIFGGSLKIEEGDEEKLAIIVDKEIPSPWLTALPYVGILVEIHQEKACTLLNISVHDACARRPEKENINMFVEAHGIPTLINLLTRNSNCRLKTLNQGLLSLSGIALCVPHQIIENNGLELILDCLESKDIKILDATLLLTKNLTSDNHQVVHDFVHSGGIPLLLKHLVSNKEMVWTVAFHILINIAASNAETCKILFDQNALAAVRRLQKAEKILLALKFMNEFVKHGINQVNNIAETKRNFSPIIKHITNGETDEIKIEAIKLVKVIVEHKQNFAYDVIRVLLDALESRNVELLKATLLALKDIIGAIEDRVTNQIFQDCNDSRNLQALLQHENEEIRELFNSITNRTNTDQPHPDAIMSSDSPLNTTLEMLNNLIPDDQMNRPTEPALNTTANSNVFEHAGNDSINASEDVESHDVSALTRALDKLTIE